MCEAERAVTLANLTREQEAKLSASDTKAGKLQHICLAVLRVLRFCVIRILFPTRFFGI